MKTFIKSLPVTLFCTLICIVQPGWAQSWRNDPNVVFYKGMPVDTTKETLTPQMRAFITRAGRIKQLGHEHFLVSNLGAQNIGVRFDKKSELYEGLETITPNNDFTSILVDGEAGIELIAQDVNPQNAKNYLFRVIQNDRRELVGWTMPNQFKTTTDGRYTYAYLGKFGYQPNQVLRVEIYNVKNFREQDAVTIDWRKVVKPNVTAYAEFWSRMYPTVDNGVVDRSFYPKDKNTRLIKGKEVPMTPPELDFIKSPSSQDLKIRLADSVQRLWFMIGNAKRIYNYKVSLKRDADGLKDSINLGETNYDFYLYKEFWKTPGKYQITFTPKIHRHGGRPVYLLRGLATSIPFTVLPAVNVPLTVSATVLITIVAGVVLAALLILVFYRRRQKRKLFQQAQGKEIINLQLASVRAQLNPHFVFNALAGIQNLVNKNEMENANKYLVRFARITRNVLDEGNRELTSIQHEMALLNDYLEMEQMRFGFAFNINTNHDVIDQQIEIPAMLLQPFAENAVKHGVSALQQAGAIRIGVDQVDNTLLLTVWDNGKGFDQTVKAGIGIELCEKRIRLLNSIYKNTTILLHKGRENNGTLITIELKNWL
ncbi:sensor histidine kinase [Mucilaginibacter celer]|uniref:Signal transduction histidine kinase internal region domain-containing protein n=1 Tax=Mucilaginibacter celer TaxID=2305508 RepID=A0A494W2L5_9SPHI|nr:histidine kinase [Mucilaginibacter celer]AYL97798.1 hypothetical protein HYN43_021980 [Mucilaginibacter celer]